MNPSYDSVWMLVAVAMAMVFADRRARQYTIRYLGVFGRWTSEGVREILRESGMAARKEMVKLAVAATVFTVGSVAAGTTALHFVNIGTTTGGGTPSGPGGPFARGGQPGDPQREFGGQLSRASSNVSGVASPTLTRISRDVGPKAGNVVDTINIAGSGFDGGTTLTFGDTAVANLHVSSGGDTLFFTVPRRATATGLDSATVTACNGAACTSFPDPFYYDDAPSDFNQFNNFEDSVVGPDLQSETSAGCADCSVAASTIQAFNGSTSMRMVTDSATTARLRVTGSAGQVNPQLDDVVWSSFATYADATTLTRIQPGQNKLTLHRDNDGSGPGYTFIGWGVQFDTGSDGDLCVRDNNQGQFADECFPAFNFQDEWFTHHQRMTRNSGTGIGCIHVFINYKLMFSGCDSGEGWSGTSDPDDKYRPMFGFITVQGTTAGDKIIFIDDVRVADGYVDFTTPGE